MLGSLPIGLLFVVIGMEVDFRGMGMNLSFFAVLLGAVIGAKFLGSWIATRISSDLVGERSLIMVGTLPQGEMGILLAAYLFSRALVTPPQFNIAILVVVMLTMSAPVLMKASPLLSSPHEWERNKVGGERERV